MATITDTTTDANGNIIINVSSSADDAITLATAGTYSDKNIIFNVTTPQSTIQPDWNQNDETQPDYVKNKPFYTGDPVKTEIIPETTVTFSKMEGIMAAAWPESFDLIDGQTYTISWDGTDYVCTGILFNGTVPVLGNLGILDAGENTGEPFIFLNQGQWLVASTESATEHVISISEYAAQIVKIDKKYLPDTAFTEAEWDFISNRPLYYKQLDVNIASEGITSNINVGTNYIDLGVTIPDFNDGLYYKVEGEISFRNNSAGLTYPLQINGYYKANSSAMLSLGTVYDSYSKKNLVVSLYGNNSHFYTGKLEVSSSGNSFSYTITADFIVISEVKKLSEDYMPDSMAKTSDIPSALPNPNALTFTGAVTGSYDGSSAVTINIPDSSGDTIPDYVIAEAEATIAKSFSHGNLGRTIRFIATSDSHNDANNMATADPNIAIGNKHCGQAIKYIADRIGIDFIAFLGDATWAGTADLDSVYSQSMLIQDIEQFNGFIADGYKGIPNIRIVGNHDQEYTTKDTSGRLWNSGAYNLFGRYCHGIKVIPAGYGYLDLDNAKVRVIYLNTSDIPSATTAGSYLGMTQEQINWLAETLLEVGDKANWKILILSHAPLDLINKSDVLTAYVNGTTYGSYDFANHNQAQLLANVHGHIHCYSYGYMEDKIRRFCIPNLNFKDNNHYKNNASYAQWTDETTYPKTANSGKDTAFSLVTIDLDSGMCYVDNYGAGIDREFSCDYHTPAAPAPTVLLNLDRDYVAGTKGESVTNHLDESKAYTNVGYGNNLEFYDKACTHSDVSENSVTVKESGLGGICITYPVHLPDLATQDYVLSFNYSGPGKKRVYYRLSTDAGAISASHSVVDETAGASGTQSVTISAGGQAYTWLIVMFSSNTGNTKSYTNVKLEKAN